MTVLIAPWLLASCAFDSMGLAPGSGPDWGPDLAATDLASDGPLDTVPRESFSDLPLKPDGKPDAPVPDASRDGLVADLPRPDILPDAAPWPDTTSWPPDTGVPCEKVRLYDKYNCKGNSLGANTNLNFCKAKFLPNGGSLNDKVYSVQVAGGVKARLLEDCDAKSSTKKTFDNTSGTSSKCYNNYSWKQTSYLIISGNCL